MITLDWVPFFSDFLSHSISFIVIYHLDFPCDLVWADFKFLEENAHFVPFALFSCFDISGLGPLVV